MRSARRIALLDQVMATVQASQRYLTANEIADRMGPRVYYSDVFPLLDFLHERGTIVKLVHPQLRNVLWGPPSGQPGFAYEFATLREERNTLRLALGLAPEPTDDESWIERYRDWWAGERRQALGA